MPAKPTLGPCRAARGKQFPIRFLLLAFVASGFTAGAAVRPAQDFLVEAGKAKAVIVLGDNSDPFYGFVGEELQRYVKAITGASRRDGPPSRWDGDATRDAVPSGRTVAGAATALASPATDSPGLPT